MVYVMRQDGLHLIQHGGTSIVVECAQGIDHGKQSLQPLIIVDHRVVVFVDDRREGFWQ